MKKETLEEKDSNTYEGKYREIETKITYEYPKGKFRFPLIEDKKQDRRLRPEKTTSIEKATNKQQHDLKQNIKNGKKKTTVELESKPIANKTKKPFRYTEVASPIFGFQKQPDEKANPLEFELSDSDVIKKADHIIADFYKNQKNNQFNNKSETNNYVLNQSRPLSSLQDESTKALSCTAEPVSPLTTDHDGNLSSAPVMQEVGSKDELTAALLNNEKETQDDELEIPLSIESASAEPVSPLITDYEDNLSSAPVMQEVGSKNELIAALLNNEKETQDDEMGIPSSIDSASAEPVSPPATDPKDNLSSVPIMQGVGSKDESTASLLDIEKETKTQDHEMEIPSSSIESVPAEPVLPLATDPDDNLSSVPVMQEESPKDESEAVLLDIEKGTKTQDYKMEIPSSIEFAPTEPVSPLVSNHEDRITSSFSEAAVMQETNSESGPENDEDILDHVANQKIEVAATLSEDVALSSFSFIKDNERNSSRNDTAAMTSPRSLPGGQKEESKRKQSIPFNVVMLKSDKRVLEEKNNQQKKAAVLGLQKLNKQTDQQLKPHVHTSEREDKAEAAIRTETTQQTRVLPFNVMMLKSDKKAFKKSQEQQQSIQGKMEEKALLEFEKKEQGQSALMTLEKSEHHVALDDPYTFPQLELLDPPVTGDADDHWVSEQTELLNETLANFKVRAKVVHVSQGPSVTRFEIQPEKGVKVNKITNLSDDLKLNLAARDIRIEAPIPGKSTIGIEIPNKKSRPVFLREIISSTAFKQDESPLTAALGLDISGHPIVTDLQKMPHGLIAGATGSGKSVCINSILVSLLYKATPDELKLLLIDPKMVELAPYHHIPHLVSPVITDVKAATAALKWAVAEMERRYELFAHTSVRNIQRFNELAEKAERPHDKLPYIVIVIDELADLMMMSPADVEEAICRIAQKARACGIHLIIATQRPSVDVITGLIKANVPTRIAFSVSSQIDSRTIIDMSGAEKLLGRGDMLFLANGSSKAIRLQGTFVTDEEIDCVIAHVREQREPQYLFQQEELLKRAQLQEEEDDLFFDACDFVIDQGSASTSLLQRHFRVGYNRAARLITLLEEHGVVSEARGSKPRDVLVSQEDIEAIKQSSRIV